MHFIRHFLLFACLLTLTITCQAANASDTIRLYFDLGNYSLTTKAKNILDSSIYNDLILPGIKLGIIGYADYLGDSSSNITLSINRANTIKAYFLSMNIAENDIEIVTGKGEISRTEITGIEGYPTDRRVDVIIGGFRKKTLPTAIIKPEVKLIDLKTVQKNETIRIDNIFFYPGRHAIRELSLNTLDALYTLMIENTKLKIRIEGHICCQIENTADGYDFDTHIYNLSEARAKAVYDYLIDRNIDKERLEYKGYGKTHPLKYPEMNEEDENMNRRVEIRIIDK